MPCKINFSISSERMMTPPLRTLILAARGFLQGGRQMPKRTTRRIALFGTALGMILIPLLSGKLQAQQIDLNATAEAKAQAGREARSRPVTDPPGPKAVGTFITFDAPGAGTGLFQGTFPASINEAGDITGNYVDANGLGHGFVRAGNSTFTTFDVPGGTITDSASSINPAGSVTGAYTYLNDPDFVNHGYLRAKLGAFTTFDVPGAALIFTVPSSINPAGAIAGTYSDGVTFLPDGSVLCVAHGFLRAKNGTIATFDAPGADTNPLDCGINGTEALGINPEGIILGDYTDTNGNSHAYLRATDATFTIFDPPGPIALFNSLFRGPTPLYMNPQGVITGAYFQTISGNPFGGNYRVFVRATDGTFTTFDAVMYPNGNPSLNIPCCTWSFPGGITPSGSITGAFNDGFNLNHGFLRASDGTITTFDAPGAGTGFQQGTAPMGITPSGVIMGFYRDPKYAHHGFLFYPRSCC
jgi:hypothetical protein